MSVLLGDGLYSFTWYGSAGAGHYPTVGLTEEEFEALKQSRHTLSHALMLEESYDLLVSNHEELEKQLADIAVRLMMREEHSYKEFFAIKALISRRIANVLTAARCYVDQAPRHHERIMDSESERDAAKVALNEAYESSQAFRFMEAYRNHVQHYSAALDSMSLGGARDKITKQLAYVVEPYADRAKLEINPKFKKKVLAELDTKVDLRRMARGYIAAFSKVHIGLRKRAIDRVTAAADLVHKHVKDYEDALGRRPAGLYAIKREDGKEVDAFPLMVDWDSARSWLADINGSLIDLERHYVTTQLKVEG